MFNLTEVKFRWRLLNEDLIQSQEKEENSKKGSQRSIKEEVTTYCIYLSIYLWFRKGNCMWFASNTTPVGRFPCKLCAQWLHVSFICVDTAIMSTSTFLRAFISCSWFIFKSCFTACHIATDCAVQCERGTRAKRELVFLCDTDIEVSEHMCVWERRQI